MAPPVATVHPAQRHNLTEHVRDHREPRWLLVQLIRYPTGGDQKLTEHLESTQKGLDREEPEAEGVEADPEILQGRRLALLVDRDELAVSIHGLVVLVLLGQGEGSLPARLLIVRLVHVCCRWVALRPRTHELLVRAEAPGDARRPREDVRFLLLGEVR